MFRHRQCLVQESQTNLDWRDEKDGKGKREEQFEWEKIIYGTKWDKDILESQRRTIFQLQFEATVSFRRVQLNNGATVGSNGHGYGLFGLVRKIFNHSQTTYSVSAIIYWCDCIQRSLVQIATFSFGTVKSTQEKENGTTTGLEVTSLSPTWRLAFLLISFTSMLVIWPSSDV